MRLRFKNKIDFTKADSLIAKYYEGLSTVEDEKYLHEFLSRSNLPNKYAADQAVFGYFAAQKTKRTFRITPLIRSSVAAAAVIALVFSIQISTNETSASYAFVDGHKITDLKEIKLNALASLNEISAGPKYIHEGLNNVSGMSPIREQLEVFAEIE